MTRVPDNWTLNTPHTNTGETSRPGLMRTLA